MSNTWQVNGQPRNAWEEQRRQMVEQEVVGAGVQNPRVIAALRQTPRHLFVPRAFRHQAYLDMALPIGQQQTISSPFIVAYMTECLDPQPDDQVLEVGTGSGYQAAVLSPLVKQVYTIEIVESLGRRAATTLKRLRYDNVHVKIGDGFQGWPEHAPFDKIIVTCSPEDVPQPLVDQLKEGGRMVIPVGERYQQTMYLFRKVDGKLQSETLRPTLFVPMTGRAETLRDIQPDPARPQAVNGSFEEAVGEDGFLPGWYYQRQAERIETDEAPEGRYVVEFRNQEPGRGSRMLQGLAIDGRIVRQLELSAWVRTEQVRPGPHDELPSVILTFYDHQRREVGQWWLGPWRGTQEWTRQQKTVRVPAQAREAILRIGLFGAVGTAAFDQVTVQAVGS